MSNNVGDRFYVMPHSTTHTLTRGFSNRMVSMTTIKSFTAKAYERDRVAVESAAYRHSNADVNSS